MPPALHHSAQVWWAVPTTASGPAHDAGVIAPGVDHLSGDLDAGGFSGLCGACAEQGGGDQSGEKSHGVLLSIDRSVATIHPFVQYYS
jgi:hypothetical protein